MFASLMSFCALLSTAVLPVPATTVDQPQLTAVEASVIAHTNAQRVRNGLPALQVDMKLVTTARKHAVWMTNHHSMVHGNYGVAENIAAGQPTAGSVVNTWMNSSGHRANILNRGHRRIGVAAYRQPNGQIYWCQQFQN